MVLFVRLSIFIITFTLSVPTIVSLCDISKKNQSCIELYDNDNQEAIKELKELKELYALNKNFISYYFSTNINGTMPSLYSFKLGYSIIFLKEVFSPPPEII